MKIVDPIIVHLDTGVINHHGDLSWRRLDELGQFTHYPQTTGLDQFIAHAGDAHAVITMRSPVTREMIYSARDLEIICSGTVGFDHIDLEAANERGITVTHVPSSDIAASAVAQGTMALLLGLRIMPVISPSPKALRIGERTSNGPIKAQV